MLLYASIANGLMQKIKFLCSMSDVPLLPVRRLHNFLYCPRLFYLQWVEELFVENADTAAGSALHHRVDAPSHGVESIELDEREKLRSIALSSDILKITGKIDLIETHDHSKTLIDYKRGAPRIDDDGYECVRENDAMQLAAYALLLAENGVSIESAVVYYASVKKRITITIDDALKQKCIAYIEQARDVARRGQCPPALENDARCFACSAYPICLPNESSFWRGQLPSIPKHVQAPRPPLDHGEIIVVQNNAAYVGRKGGEITVSLDKEIVTRHPLEQIQAIYLYGTPQVSTQALQSFMEKSIPVAHFSAAGRFLGMTSGLPTTGVDARMGQYRLFSEPSHRLIPAKEIIRCKIHNQRVMLMRNGDVSDETLKQLASLRERCMDANDLDQLRGIEGMAANLYFGQFTTMLKGSAFELFDFDGRNRRPPKDPINCLLSMAYSILSKELTGFLSAVGLDPFLGFMHQPRYGRPALALDMMEEFRPLVADSVVLALLNRGEITKSDFAFTSQGVLLKDAGRRAFWNAWARRLDSELTHPQFDYKISYRRTFDVQCRQLWRFCRGEADRYYGITTR